MADGISMKSPKLDATMRRLRRIVPEADAAIDAANQKTAEELAALAKSAAPKRSGDLADSIRAEAVNDGGTRGWGVFAIWRWFFIEFGTVNHRAQPFLFPVYRLLKKRHIGRIRRGVNKAIKTALRK